MSYILGAILIYLLYRFITGFVWPVYKATSSFKKQFESARQQMYDHADGGAQPGEARREEPRSKPAPKGDYIPFEEIKES